MSSRKAFGVLLILLAVSTICGFGLAVRYWRNESVELALGMEDAVLLVVRFSDRSEEGALEPLALLEKRLPEVRSALTKLVSRSAGEVARFSGCLRDEPACRDGLVALSVSWRDDVCTFEYGPDDRVILPSCTMPVDWLDEEDVEGLRLRSLELVTTFAEDRLASVLMILDIANDEAQATQAGILETNGFWKHGDLEFGMANLIAPMSDEEERADDHVGVSMEPPGACIAPEMLTRLLHRLADCVGSHCRAFASEELNQAVEDNDLLRSVVLHIERPCAVSGRSVGNCEMVHSSYVNGRSTLAGIADRTIPLSLGYLCYTIFGI